MNETDPRPEPPLIDAEAAATHSTPYQAPATRRGGNNAAQSATAAKPHPPATEAVRPYPVPAVVSRYMPALRRMYERRQAGRLPGITTGFPSLDRETGGLQPGLHMLAASPGAGKTTLALQMSRAAAQDGAAVTYLAMDEGGDRLGVKLVAGMAGISATSYLRGEQDPSTIEQAAEAHREVLSKIEIYSGPLILPADAKSMLEARMKMVGTEDGLMVVDFLQSWATRMATGVEFRAAVTALTGQLREAAIALEVPILAIVAQNRQKQGTADLSSLRESSDLEYMADSAFFITEDSDYAGQAQRRVTIKCAKNRWGGMFEIQAGFDAAHGRFWELPR